MSLRDERRDQNTSNRSFFKEHVRSVKLSNPKTASVFRMLPAFDPANPDPATSVLPCVDPAGEPNDFGKYIYVAACLGRGNQRRDIISPKTFNTDASCPLDALVDAATQDKATWEYMVKDDESKNHRKCLQRASVLFCINCLEMQQPHAGPILGFMSKSAGNALVDMCCVRNNNAALVSLAAQQGYLIGFANGDITDYRGGMLLTCATVPNSKKSFAEYKVEALLVEDPMTGTKSTRMYPVDSSVLARRYRIMQPETYLQAKSYEDIVKDLVFLYNKRSPSGMHEYHLLRTAFPDFTALIPEPPAAPAASSTVASGWSNPSNGFTPPSNGFTPPSNGFAPSAGGFTPPSNGFTPPAGGFTPPAGGFIPGQPMIGFPGIPVQPSQTQPLQTQPLATSPLTNQLPDLSGSGMTPSGMPPAGVTAPVAPGDPIPSFDPNAIGGMTGDMAAALERIKRNSQPQA